MGLVVKLSPISGLMKKGPALSFSRTEKSWLVADFGLARYHSDGSLDLAFGNGGRLTSFTGIQKLIQYADGRILARSGSRLARFEANGAYDLTFGNVGIANVQSYNDFAIDPTGNIVTVGQVGNYPQYDIVVRRYSSTGVPGLRFCLFRGIHLQHVESRQFQLLRRGAQDRNSPGKDSGGWSVERHSLERFEPVPVL